MKTNRLNVFFIMLLGLGMALPVFSAIPQTEHDALMALYNSTNGPGWTNSANWGGALGTENTWYGVSVASVAGQDHVTYIDLESNHLSGTIPIDLAGC